MNIQIHYENEEGPQVYNITAMTSDDMKQAIEHFKSISKLSDEQFTIEVLTSGI